MSDRNPDVNPLPHSAAEMFRLMAEEIKECAMFLMDPHGIITVWNKAAERMKGYTEEEAIGQFIGILYTDEQKEKGWPQHNLGEAKKHGFYREETWRRRKDGKLFWAHIALTALLDKDDVLLGFAKVTLDLTEHKRLEECIKEKEETRRILEAASAGTWKWNLGTDTVDVSPHMLALLGYEEKEIGLHLQDWISLIHPDDRKSAKAQFKTVTARCPDQQLSIEMRMRRKDGQYRWFYARADWYRDHETDPYILMGVSVDIDDVKLLAHERERLFDQLQAERVRFQAILDQLPSSVVIAEKPSGKVIYQNREADKLLAQALSQSNSQSSMQPSIQSDAPAGDRLGMAHGVEEYSRLRHLDGRRMRAEEFPLTRAVLHGEVTKAEQICYRQDNGGLVHFSVTAAPIVDQDGQSRTAVAVLHDIQALKEMQQSLELEKERAQVTLIAITDGVITTDLEGRVDRVNPAAERLTGWTQDGARGRPIADVFHIVDETGHAPIGNPITRCVAEDRVITSSKHVVLVSRTGQRYSVEHSAAPIRLSGNRLDGAVLVIRDVTESRLLLSNLSYQASHDALTGLLNRREFGVRLQRTLDRINSVPPQHAALLYMDLDQFKIINDTCGHAAGDDLLHQLASEYRAHVRDRDTLARIGGDEFAMILDHCSLDDAYQVAQKVLDTTQAFRYTCKDRSFQIGISIGLIPIDSHAATVEEALRLADHACYLAKETGRNRIFVQQNGNVDMKRRLNDMHWVTRLGEAFLSDQLQLYYQPIYPLNASKGQQSGLHYEILLRMNDGENGLIGPTTFLPAAERYHVMPDVDRWVLSKSLQWLGKHPEHVERLEMCTINLSQRTLADKSFQQFAADLIGASTVPAEKLCFEITETGAVANMNNTLSFINKLTALGCCFALDDFGTGMASFAYLKQIPVDFVKIDGSFIQLMTKSEVDFEMVRFTNEISHLMGRMTIAEYVTDELILQKLKDIGVDFAQGFWLGEPQPLEE